MISTTVSRLCCPRRSKRGAHCRGSLEIVSKKSIDFSGFSEIRSGFLKCRECQASYPILAGVAILVEDAGNYLLEHVKGVSKIVPDAEIPQEFRDEFLEAKSEIHVEHIEEDLESDRVVALYLMTHYLHASDPGTPPWWSPRSGSGSPVMDALIREYWDQGPFSKIEGFLKEKGGHRDIVELGCGVGGLYPRLMSWSRSYLGVDSSFASVALGRYLALGAPYEGELRIPEDLLQGPISRKIQLPTPKAIDGKADLIVGDLTAPLLKEETWDLAIALNAIDMLEDPSALPKLQNSVLKKGGLAIQSCPYIWHESVAKKLRAKLPPTIQGSARAVEWLYSQHGLKTEKSIDHVPWLFFKHIRQLELYSAHVFMASKES